MRATRHVPVELAGQRLVPDLDDLAGKLAAGVGRPAHYGDASFGAELGLEVLRLVVPLVRGWMRLDEDPATLRLDPLRFLLALPLDTPCARQLPILHGLLDPAASIRVTLVVGRLLDWRHR